MSDSLMTNNATSAQSAISPKLCFREIRVVPRALALAAAMHNRCWERVVRPSAGAVGLPQRCAPRPATVDSGSGHNPPPALQQRSQEVGSPARYNPFRAAQTAPTPAPLLAGRLPARGRIPLT